MTTKQPDKPINIAAPEDRATQLTEDLQLYLKLKEELDTYKEFIATTAEALNVVSKRIANPIACGTSPVIFESQGSDYICSLEEEFHDAKPLWSGIRIEQVSSPQKCIEDADNIASSCQ